MFQHSVRAVYQDGLLRPLEPLALEDGETVDINVISSRQTSITPDEADALLRAAGLLSPMELNENIQELSPAELERIGRLFVGSRPSDEIIDEERGLY